MADHNIEVRLIAGHAVPQLQLVNGNMVVGQTVRYFSHDGALRVKFEDGSPFAETEIADELPHTLTKDGKFFSKCFLTIGWSQAKPESGGDQEVKPKI